MKEMDQMLRRNIEQELGDLPYAVVEHAEYLEVRRIELAGRLPGQDPKILFTWLITTAQDWEDVREVIVPTQDLLGAYVLYQDPDFATDRQKILQQLAAKGITPEQAEARIKQ